REVERVHASRGERERGAPGDVRRGRGSGLDVEGEVVRTAVAVEVAPRACDQIGRRGGGTRRVRRRDDDVGLRWRRRGGGRQRRLRRGRLVRRRHEARAAGGEQRHERGG